MNLPARPPFRALERSGGQVPRVPIFNHGGPYQRGLVGGMACVSSIFYLLHAVSLDQESIAEAANSWWGRCSVDRER
jgi:hypothetical protein